MRQHKKRYDSKYHDPWVFSLALKGATDDEIAEAIGVSRMTIHRWSVMKNDKGEEVLSLFGEARRAGKEQADAQVVKALYERCIGFDVTEVQQIIEQVNGDGKVLPRVKETRTTKKRIIPDPMAIMYWLNNRCRKTGEWSQKQDVNVSFGDESIRNAVKELTLNEARAKLAAIRAEKNEGEE